MAAWSKAHATQLYLGGMAVLLVLRILIMVNDTGFAPPEKPTVREATLPSELTVDSDLYKRVRGLIEPPATFQNSQYQMLAQYNMFDPQSVQNADQIKQQANQLYTQANQTYQQAMTAVGAGNTAQAEQLLNTAMNQTRQALTMQPSHAGALDLRKQINDQLEALRNPAPTPTPPAG